ncbi:MAG: hypothetical protein OSJ27_03910 [Candidatus Gastranaerophilales bacterium]|nr:hypothetical protein [Candidatus Gastranaerophilales bacterium]
MFKINPEATVLKASLESKTEAEKAQTKEVKGNLFAEPENNGPAIKINKSEATAPSINEDKAKEYAQSLCDAMKGFGADGKAVDAIILDESLNSYDIVSIMSKYGSVNRRHTLEKDLAREFMGKHEDKLLQRITDACFEVYADDNMANCGLHRIARLALENKTLQDFMLEKGMIKKDDESDNIRTSTMILGIRG